MKTCPFFGKCGGCKYDFGSPDYKTNKLAELNDVTITGAPVWIAPGSRRRADFCFASGRFGFFESHSKDIVPITHCPNLIDDINAVLPDVAKLPWNGAGSVLITACDNGVDMCVTANVPFFIPEFRLAVEQLPLIRVTWNGHTVILRQVPIISFDKHVTEYPVGAFLQPSVQGADVLRKMVTDAASGARHTADLFCGFGNFTFALNATGFDIIGVGVKRDLFKNPLTLGMLQNYDCVVMDPPRAGAIAQCQILSRSNIGKVIYVSCNPKSWQRDATILMRGGYVLQTLVPVDQFAGSAHWELFSVFQK